MSVACVAGDKEHARRAVGGAGPASAALVRSVARSVNASRELIEDACQTAWRRVPVTQRATDASQRQRNATLTAENKRLRPRTANSRTSSANAAPRRELLAGRTPPEDPTSSRRSLRFFAERTIRLANVKRGASR
jgi:hypothetical protein